MKVTMLLADAAEAVNGKLYIMGGGWSVTGPAPMPSAIALKIEVPWHQANDKHKLELALITADGEPVLVPTEQGERPLVIQGVFETGRPAGLKKGSPLDATLAVTIAPLPLKPDSRYVWKLSINGESHEDWQVAFSTRPGNAGPMTVQ